MESVMGGSASICVVDDDKSNLSMMRVMLLASGFRNVACFWDAIEALEFIGKTLPDLVVSDWNIEPMSGIELLQHVREGLRTRSIPFVMVTAQGSEYYWKRALQEGATEFLFKPFSLRAFRDAVEIGLSFGSPASVDGANTKSGVDCCDPAHSSS
jgi:two-component system, chemotaxis family, chemotaxis protein CheY